MAMLAQRGAVILVIVALPLVGCSDTCTDLAKKICSCRPTQTEQQACDQTISSSSRPGASKKEQEVCSERLDTCTCDALKEGQLELCGLADQ